jgi:hypothetical protein
MLSLPHRKVADGYWLLILQLLDLMLYNQSIAWNIGNKSEGLQLCLLFICV